MCSEAKKKKGILYFF